MKAPPGVEILGDKHLSVLAVAAPLSEAQEAAVLEAAATPTSEVEMIKEKKEDGTEVEAKPGEKTAAKAGEGAAAKPGEKGEKAGAKPGEKAAPAAEKAGDKKGGEKKKH
jgi:hypothetical protein